MTDADRIKVKATEFAEAVQEGKVQGQFCCAYHVALEAYQRGATDLGMRNFMTHQTAMAEQVHRLGMAASTYRNLTTELCDAIYDVLNGGSDPACMETLKVRAEAAVKVLSEP